MKMMILIMALWIPPNIVVFFAKPNGNIDHVISDESVKK